MPTAKVRASTILREFDQAQSELVGKAVILTDGKAGTVESVWLDEMHGLQNLDQGPRRKVACLNHQICGRLLNSPSGPVLNWQRSQRRAVCAKWALNILRVGFHLRCIFPC